MIATARSAPAVWCGGPMGFRALQAVHACFGWHAACVEAACLDALGLRHRASLLALAATVSTPSGSAWWPFWIRSGPQRQIEQQLWPAAAVVAESIGPWAGWSGSYTCSSRPGCAGGQLVIRVGIACLGTGAGGGSWLGWLLQARLRSPVASGQPDPLVRLSRPSGAPGLRL